jgi:hypothetical protein
MFMRRGIMPHLGGKLCLTPVLPCNGGFVFLDHPSVLTALAWFGWAQMEKTRTEQNRMDGMVARQWRPASSDVVAVGG